MSNELQIALIIVVLVLVGGFAGYRVWLNWKLNGSKGNIIALISFCLENINYFVDALQSAMTDLGGIDRKQFSSDAEYRRKFIEVAVDIITKRAAESGIKFNLPQSTISDLAELVISKVIELTEEKAVQAKLLEEALNSEPPKPKALDDNGTTDISKDIEGFYDK